MSLSVRPGKAVVLRSGYCLQAQQFFARTSGLTSSRMQQYNLLVSALVNAGIWQKLDVFYIFAAPNSTVALTNLVSSNFAGTAAGSPTFTTDIGYTGVDASTTVRIDSGFNPTTATSPNFTQNSAHISSWCNTNAASGAAGGVALGLTTGNFTVCLSAIYSKYQDGKQYYRINDPAASASDGVSVSDPRGHILANRSGSAAQQGYLNGVDQGIVAVTSAAPTNGNIYILGINQTTIGEVFGDDHQNMAVSIGGSLTAAQALIFSNAMRKFMQSVANIAY